MRIITLVDIYQFGHGSEVRVLPRGSRGQLMRIGRKFHVCMFNGLNWSVKDGEFKYEEDL